MDTNDSKTFWQYDIEYWYKKTESTETGLTEAKVKRLSLSQGKGKKVKSPFYNDISLYVGQFLNPLMLLLIGATILSAFFGDIADVFIILFIVLTAGTLGFFQERNAGRVVEKLQSLLSLKCTVLRDGKYTEIKSKSILPGDIIVFNAGDIVPADCILISSNELHINEASLTGESFPVRKNEGKIPGETILSKRTNCL